VTNIPGANDEEAVDMGVFLRERDRAAAQAVDLTLHEHEIGANVVRAAPRRRKLIHVVARLLVVAVFATALAGCGCVNCSRATLKTANDKKFIELKSNIPRPLPSTNRSGFVFQTANTEKYTESKSSTPIPVPAASLLSPQPEPSCEISDINADERQKLDYERQCYRHAEMIVRSRLHVLQGAVDKTISAIKRNERSDQ
jgi:hypothetical protein